MVKGSFQKPNVRALKHKSIVLMSNREKKQDISKLVIADKRGEEIEMETSWPATGNVGQLTNLLLLLQPISGRNPD